MFTKSIDSVLLFILSYILVVASGAELPTTFKKCEVKDGNFKACLASSIEAAIKESAAGVPALNIPSLDPIVIPELTIGAGQGPVDVVQNLKNVLLHGYSTVQVKKASADLDKKTLEFEVLVANMTQEADYDLNGRILALPVSGKGHLIYSLKNNYLIHTMKMEEVKKKNEIYFKVVDYKLTMKPEIVHFFFDNLFNGDIALRDALNKALNDNWEVVFEDSRHAYEEAYAIVFKQYANRIFAKIPIKKIFNF